MRPIHSDINALSLPAADAPCPATPDPLTIAVVVDVEEGFDWNEPFSQKNVNVSALETLGKAQEIFDRYGIVPAYVMTYPVAVSEEGKRAIAPVLDQQKCLIGAQLHPWVTPPLKVEMSGENS